MHKLTRVFVYALWSSLSAAALAQRPAPAVDGYAVFSEMRANAPVGGCGCFWMSGAHGGFSLPMWREFSVVVEAGGHHNGQIPNFNVGLSLLYGMGGLRMRVANQDLLVAILEERSAELEGVRYHDLLNIPRGILF